MKRDTSEKEKEVKTETKKNGKVKAKVPKKQNPDPIVCKHFFDLFTICLRFFPLKSNFSAISGTEKLR